MNIQIGDIVLAKNRYGKTGRYIITKFGKGQATFRGVFVVSSPKETERAEDIRKLGNYGYALLKHAYSDMNPECVLEVVARLGIAYGNRIEEQWKSARRRKNSSDPKSLAIYTHCFNVGRYVPTTSRAMPKQVSRFCSGGMVRPK